MDLKEKGWYLLFQSLINIHKSYDTAVLSAKKAIFLLDNSYAYIVLMRIYYHRGHYINLIDLKEEALLKASDEGNTQGILQIHALIGNSYSNLGFFHMMLKHYKVIENINGQVKDSDFHYIVNYNIGATYLTVNKYEKSINYLNKIQDTSDINSTFWINHKLFFAYEGLNKIDKMEKSYHIMKDIMDRNPDLVRDAPSLLMDIMELHLEEGYMDKKEYIDKLESLCNFYKTNHHRGYYLFNSSLLEKAYINNRRYKDAYILVKENSTF